MGVDWRGPMEVPSSTTKQWSITCSKCGKVELTTNTKQEFRRGEIDGIGGKVTVPTFD